MKTLLSLLLLIATSGTAHFTFYRGADDATMALDCPKKIDGKGCGSVRLASYPRSE
jgi:hypothetical protein